jgi:hypothetical protein
LHLLEADIPVPQSNYQDKQRVHNTLKHVRPQEDVKKVVVVDDSSYTQSHQKGEDVPVQRTRFGRTIKPPERFQ